MGIASVAAERPKAATAGRDAAPAPPGAGAQRERVNVSELERAASAVLGGVLLAGFIGRRRSAGGAALGLVGAELVRRGVTGHCVAYQALGVRTAPAEGAAAAPAVERWITIGRSADELYRLWREPETLPRVVGSLAEVTMQGPDRARWVVRGPGGRQLAWETQVVEDRPGELVRWESLAGAAVPNEGEVRFRPAPQDWGTEVTLHFRFEPPGGALGAAAAKLLDAVPGTLAGIALRRFKSLAETGEIPTLERNPSARGRGDTV